MTDHEVDYEANVAEPAEEAVEPQLLLSVLLSVEGIKLVYTILEQVPIQGPDAKQLASEVQRAMIDAVSVLN